MLSIEVSGSKTREAQSVLQGSFRTSKYLELLKKQGKSREQEEELAVDL